MAKMPADTDPMTMAPMAGGYGGYGGPHMKPGMEDVVDDMFCSTEKPPTAIPCGTCDEPDDFNPRCNFDGRPAGCGDGDACSSNGECVDDVCACAPGYFGQLCDSGCPWGDWDPTKCECCPSGVISGDGKGECCASDGFRRPTLDKDGACCAKGWLDECGVCGGEGGAVDRNGDCCPVRPSSLCPRLAVGRHRR